MAISNGVANIRSSIYSSIRSSIRDSISGGGSPEVIQRYFVTLNNVAQSYYYLPTPIEFEGDFIWSVYIKVSDKTRDQAIFNSSSFSGTDGEVLFYLDNPDGLELLVGGGAGGFTRYIFGGQDLIMDGKLNRLQLIRESGTVRCELNGALLNSTFTITDTLKMSEGLVGGGAGRYLSGVLANLVLENLAQTDTFDLDEEALNTETSTTSSNTINYMNIDSSQRELYTLNATGTQWVGDVSGDIIEIAEQA